MKRTANFPPTSSESLCRTKNIINNNNDILAGVCLLSTHFPTVLRIRKWSGRVWNMNFCGHYAPLCHLHPLFPPRIFGENFSWKHTSVFWKFQHVYSNWFVLNRVDYESAFGSYFFVDCAYLSIRLMHFNYMTHVFWCIWILSVFDNISKGVFSKARNLSEASCFARLKTFFGFVYNI